MGARWKNLEKGKISRAGSKHPLRAGIRYIFASCIHTDLRGAHASLWKSIVDVGRTYIFASCAVSNFIMVKALVKF